MEEKTIDHSSVIMRHIVSHQDANLAGITHGGVVMKHIDDAAGVVAIKHTGCNVVGKTSMEIGVRVEAEDIITQKIRHTASAYLTFVALDENNRPAPVPPIKLITEEEKRRNREALDRRWVRLAEKSKEKACRKNGDDCSDGKC